ncbi:MAG: F0F1 ATP synthase subunit beta, partial [Tannerella sp.]|nr:F0F1 ATP synthase subunit beta [Tannerella sp.]
MQQEIKGCISQIIGPVIDISFDAAAEGGDRKIVLPSIHDAVKIRRADGRVLVAEIQQH